MNVDAALFPQILAYLPDSVTIQDRNFRIIYQNNAVRKISGEAMGEECFRVYERRDQICDNCGLQKVFASGEPALVLRRVVEKDGTISHWENSCFPLFNAENEIVAGVEVCRNITERKQTLDTLHEQQCHAQSLLRLSKHLESAQSYTEAIAAARAEISQVVGFTNLWIYLLAEDGRSFDVLVAEGSVSDDILGEEKIARLTIAGDPMLEEIATAKELVIVEDARVDPRTNKEIVARLGNRTIINVPILLSGQHLGTLGTGTFGAEEVKVPTRSERDYLAAIASHMAVTLDRIRLLNERRQTEKAYLEQQKLLLETQRMAHIGNWWHNLETGEIHWSDEFFHILGIETQTPSEELIAQMIHPDDLTILLQAMAASKAGEREQEHDFRIIRADGEIRWIHNHWLRIEDEHGREIKRIGTHQDITVKKLSDEALATREREFRTLAENSPDNIARYDLSGRTVYANPALFMTLDCSADEMLGRTPAEAAHISEASAYQKKILEVLTSGEATEVDLVLPDRGKGVRYHNVRFVAERGNDGAITGVLAIGRDVTDRIHTEEERKSNLHFFETMDRVNSAITGTSDQEQMMSTILDIVLDVFDCDRSYLLSPCDPEAKSWTIPMERTRPEYPGAFVSGSAIPADPGMVAKIRRILEASGAIQFGPGAENLLPHKVAVQYGFKSCMAMAVNTKVGHPWEFGIHQCSHPRQWSTENVRLFEAIGHRIADGLTSLMSHRDLQESREFLDNIVENLPSMLFVKDAGTLNFVRFNRAGEQLLGYKRAELLGKNDYDFFPTEIADYFTANDRIALASKQPVDIPQERIRLKDHSERILHTQKIPLLDKQGGPQYLLGISEDITEFLLAEEELRKLTQAIEQSPVSIVITNAKGQIEFVNRKFSEITGYSSSEVLGQNPRVLKSGETTPDAYQQLWQTISAGKVWSGEFHNKKKNGEMFWEHATIAPVRNTDQRITHYVAVKEDITDRKRLEEQLFQSQKLESVGQLAGGVAHDFNNMLAVIIGRTEMALRKLKPTQDQSLFSSLQEIRSAAERSADLTRQLLTFARKQVISPKQILLNDALEEMLKMLRRLIGENIDLAWLPGNDQLQIKIDPVQLDQILVNLCVNARDAIDGVGHITIETRSVIFDDRYSLEHVECNPGEYVLMAVSDDGCGMDKLTLERIFEPFYTTKGIGQGTGLGLATLYGIVRQNDGFINVYSEPGNGTTFKVYLPRIIDPVTNTPAEVERPLVKGSETILLVEDEPSILSMSRQMLEDCGYQILSATTPGDALCLAKEFTGEIHLLLTDVVMPEMNGRELADLVYTLRPQISCLFMSGYTSNIIARHGVLEKGVEFIQKPFAMGELTFKIRAILDQPRRD